MRLPFQALESDMTRPTCCGASWLRPFEKLGRCRRCVALSALGAAVGWGVALGMSAYALALALPFTALLVAHALVFAGRAARVPSIDGVGLDRRGFLGAALGAALALLSRPSVIRAQQPPRENPCKGKCALEITLTFEVASTAGGTDVITNFEWKFRKDDSGKCESHPEPFVNFTFREKFGDLPPVCHLIVQEEIKQDHCFTERGATVEGNPPVRVKNSGAFDRVTIGGFYKFKCEPIGDCDVEFEGQLRSGQCVATEKVPEQKLQFAFKFDRGEVKHNGTETKTGNKVTVTWRKEVPCEGICEVTEFPR